MTCEASRRNVLKVVGATGMVGLAGCGGDGSDEGDTGANGDDGSTSTPTSTDDGSDGSSADTVRAAWVYNTEIGDLGWTWAHNEGRKAAAETYDWLETAYAQEVAPSDSKQVFRQYADDGYDIIFGCTFGYQDPMYEVSQEFPDTYFEHNTGYRTRENMGRYAGRLSQVRYMLGVAAGRLTEVNSLGFVAAFPIPEVIRNINAYTLGATSVNDEVTTKVRWTNTWFDPPKEREAAQSLIDEGVDVLAQLQDSPAGVRAANEADIWCGGYSAPMREFGEENYLSSPIWKWDAFYKPTLESVRDGSWEPDAYWEGLNSGVVDRSRWGPEVPEDIKNEVAEIRAGIKSGEIDIWAGSKFDGESTEFLYQEMGSYVENVDGTPPN